MPSHVQISCINKSNRISHYERILAVGGVSRDGAAWRLSEANAIAGIKSGTYAFYISQQGHLVDVVIAQGPKGREYLKTASDAVRPDDLLALPECPATL